MTSSGPRIAMLQVQRGVPDPEHVDVDAQGALANDVLMRCIQKFGPASTHERHQMGDHKFYITEVRLVPYGKTTRSRRAKYAFVFNISEDEITNPPYGGRTVGHAAVFVLEDLTVELRHRSGTLAHPPRGPYAKSLIDCALKGS
jgi:hypothetical protein